MGKIFIKNNKLNIDGNVFDVIRVTPSSSFGISLDISEPIDVKYYTNFNDVLIKYKNGKIDLSLTSKVIGIEVGSSGYHVEFKDKSDLDNFIKLLKI